MEDSQEGLDSDVNNEKWMDKEEARKSKANAVFDQIKREIDLKSRKTHSKQENLQQVKFFNTFHIEIFYKNLVLFVDNARNAAVNIGDRDIKTDVKAKHLRERLFQESLEILYNILKTQRGSRRRGWLYDIRPPRPV